jgi:hypothetical protein
MTAGDTVEAARIFLPMAALAGWTFAVMLLVPYARFKAAFRGRVTAADFRYGESPSVPADVRLPNRNLVSLLEVPVLFYVACLTLYATTSVDTGALYLAWLYVALRMGHSLVHLTYNNVFHRLGVYAASNLVLLTVWIRLALALADRA